MLVLNGITIGFDIVCCTKSLSPLKKNMPSACQHPEIIDNYLKEEIEYGAFDSTPFTTFVLIGLALLSSLHQGSGV